MGIKLSFETTSPWGLTTRKSSRGCRIMVMAIANHELAKEHFPGTFPSPEEMAEQQRQVGRRQKPCPAWPRARASMPASPASARSATGGRHRFRFILPPAEGLN